MAAEAHALHMQGMLEDGEAIPAPTMLEVARTARKIGWRAVAKNRHKDFRLGQAQSFPCRGAQKTWLKGIEIRHHTVIKRV